MEKYSNYCQCDLKDKNKTTFNLVVLFFYKYTLIICLGKTVVKN